MHLTHKCKCSKDYFHSNAGHEHCIKYSSEYFTICESCYDRIFKISGA